MIKLRDITFTNLQKELNFDIKEKLKTIRNDKYKLSKYSLIELFSNRGEIFLTTNFSRGMIFLKEHLFTIEDFENELENLKKSIIDFFFTKVMHTSIINMDIDSILNEMKKKLFVLLNVHYEYSKANFLFIDSLFCVNVYLHMICIEQNKNLLEYLFDILRNLVLLWQLRLYIPVLQTDISNADIEINMMYCQLMKLKRRRQSYYVNFARKITVIDRNESEILKNTHDLLFQQSLKKEFDRIVQHLFFISVIFTSVEIVKFLSCKKDGKKKIKKITKALNKISKKIIQDVFFSQEIDDWLKEYFFNNFQETKHMKNIHKFNMYKEVDFVVYLNQVRQFEKKMNKYLIKKDLI
ncbi:hypothetical protein LbFV_ORF80 [Leptopilina boulardi filamentous virus]|uniref:Uncharacterized protein n=1 Tax=Leptopilina boulardi filamentous virus TaxID=552509 RepID=A0A1S5YD11_9VIRU|nr:hypothetical protein LbFV_ORF80 [Leptopilina boulardi filamentous virus]AQQ80000.1 hypothetical protein LbFV_ORF80 [Leptopilina boulardi filamentous virus]